jgi:hypothetical protein
MGHRGASRHVPTTAVRERRPGLNGHFCPDFWRIAFDFNILSAQNLSAPVHFRPV